VPRNERAVTSLVPAPGDTGLERKTQRLRIAYGAQIGHRSMNEAWIFGGAFFAAAPDQYSRWRGLR